MTKQEILAIIKSAKDNVPTPLARFDSSQNDFKKGKSDTIKYLTAAFEKAFNPLGLEPTIESIEGFLKSKEFICDFERFASWNTWTKYNGPTGEEYYFEVPKKEFKGFQKWAKSFIDLLNHSFDESSAY